MIYVVIDRNDHNLSTLGCQCNILIVKQISSATTPNRCCNQLQMMFISTRLKKSIVLFAGYCIRRFVHDKGFLGS